MDFTNKLVLAPMAGVCDQPFRLLAKEQGCDKIGRASCRERV